MDNPHDKRPLFLTYQLVTQGWDWVRDPGLWGYFWFPVSGLLMVQEGTSAPAPESTFQPTGRRRGMAFNLKTLMKFTHHLPLAVMWLQRRLGNVVFILVD